MTNSKAVDPFDLSAGVPKIEGSLRPVPKAADRISKRVLYVVYGLVVLIVVIFFVALDAMDKKPASDAGKKQPSVAPAPVEAKGNKEDVALFGAPEAKGSGASLPRNGGGADSVPGQTGDGVKSPVASPQGKLGAKVLGPKGMVPAMGGESGMGEIPAGDQGAVGGGPKAEKPLTPEQVLARQELQARQTRMTQARSGGLSGKAFGAEEKADGGAGAGMAGLWAAAKAAQAGGGGGMQPVGFAAAGKADTEQDSKLDFLKGLGKEESRYHPHIAQPALSQNEIKVGSFIPMVLEQSINSDLPGQVTARVTEDVYDSITGCRLLVPAMAKVVGRYDSKIALGQGRMLVGWSSMIFPDGAELNLAGMQGYDSSGQAGLESDVDNHYMRMFGITFGLSMITSGVQLSVPQPNPTTNGAAAPQSPSQIVAAALAQQFGTLGAQILGKYMAVQPTLRNFAGERFIVMVPRTIVFKKVWRNRCGA